MLIYSLATQHRSFFRSIPPISHWSKLSACQFTIDKLEWALSALVAKSV